MYGISIRCFELPAHAGTNRGRGRYVYMTWQAFMEPPVELVARILKREARLAGEKDLAGYDEKVEAILLDIDLSKFYERLPEVYRGLIEREMLGRIISTGRLPDIDKILKMWDSLQRDTSYLDAWA